jgi:hypothetical protein
MPQGVRIVFHGGNATPVPALQKAGSQLIALPGCRSTDQYCQHRPSQRAGKGSRAEETRDRKPRRTLGLNGAQDRPAAGELRKVQLRLENGWNCDLGVLR